MPYTAIDHNADGSHSVDLYLNEIVHIVSGVRPYILLNRSDKYLKRIHKLTIHHVACPMDSYPKLPDLEARILSVHEIKKFFNKLLIITLVIDAPPSDFFDFVIKNKFCQYFLTSPQISNKRMAQQIKRIMKDINVMK